MEDNEIIDLFFERSEQAITETENKYSSRILGMAKNIVRNLEDAKECENDTYLALWDAIPPTRPHYFLAYVLKLTRNKALNIVAYHSAEKRSFGFTESIDELADVVDDRSKCETIDNLAIRTAINAFLKNEKETPRRIFIRKYFFFDSVKDIASEMNISESSVKNYLLRSRKRLKKFLEKEEIKL